MVRTQIQLPEEQVAILKKMAEADHKSMAEIIRQSVDFFAKAKYGGERSSVGDGQWRLPVVQIRCQGPGSLSRFLPDRGFRRMSIFIDTSGFIAVLDMEFRGRFT